MKENLKIAIFLFLLVALILQCKSSGPDKRDWSPKKKHASKNLAIIRLDTTISIDTQPHGYIRIFSKPVKPAWSIRSKTGSSADRTSDGKWYIKGDTLQILDEMITSMERCFE